LSATHRSVRKIDASGDACRAITGILDRIGDKWTVMVVGALEQGPLRYNEIRHVVSGISQRMLTLTLKGLERDGIVNRTMYPTIPPRVDYELTELGKRLMVPLRALFDWAVKQQPAMLAARKRFDEKKRLAAHQKRFTAPKVS
jgi:DNA-binding HxlR family transcriptional regulator